MTAKFEQEDAGAETSLEYDRMTIERFRSAFPKARWDDFKKAWIVPGKTASRRIARWRAIEQSRSDAYADVKGRDSFVFDPIVSAYLEAGDELIIRTPYSKTVVEELRLVPFARWDDVRRAWVVPYRGYDDLRRRWSEIEAAARRAEPTERRRRLEEAKGTEAWAESQRRVAERRKHRFPIPVGDPPPAGRPISTDVYKIVVFTNTFGELAEGDVLTFYPSAEQSSDLVWATWRSATLEELVNTWPAKAAPTSLEIARGWWSPTKPELASARKTARSLERRR